MQISLVETDTMLTVGLAVGIFAIPAVVSAISDSRPPRAAAVAVLVSGALIIAAFSLGPGGYTLQSVPDAIARTIARIIN